MTLGKIQKARALFQVVAHLVAVVDLVPANNLIHNNHKQMKIRQANKFDLPYYLHLVHKIHEMKEIGTYDVILDDTYLNTLFNTVLHGGD